MSGDGAVLVAAIEAHHPDPFRAVTRDALVQQAMSVDALGDDRHGVLVELMRTIALLGPRNGHTAIHPPAGVEPPLAVQEFDDGYFVVGTDGREPLGTELVAVDGVDIDAVSRATTPLIAYDNEWTVRARRPSFVVCDAVLRGLGVAEGDRPATFGVRRPTTTAARAPLHAQRRELPRWVDTTAGGGAVHVAYNVTRGDVTGFAAAVEQAASSSGVGIVVLDLRHNGGGDNRTYRPLLRSVQRLAETRRLAVLTSRRTFSAAMQLVVDLEQTTPAVFVGEPTGASPNQYGDAVPVHLPRTDVHAHVATIAWMTAGASDDRLAREPDIAVADQSSTYFAGRDPVLDAAIDALA